MCRKEKNGLVLVVKLGKLENSTPKYVGVDGKEFSRFNAAHELTRIVQKIIYKGWTFTVRLEIEGVGLLITTTPLIGRDHHITKSNPINYNLYDLNETGFPAPVSFQITSQPHMTKICREVLFDDSIFLHGTEYLIKEVFNAILELEKHEAQENFYLDGNRIFDPH